MSLLNGFHFNEEVLYQEAITRFPDRGGNKILGRWYDGELIHGDKHFYWTLIENNELIFRSNVRPSRRTKLPNRSVELTELIQGSSKTFPFLKYQEIIENTPHESTSWDMEEEFTQETLGDGG